MPKKTVYFMTPSLSGHLNPMCGLVHEVAKNPEIDCVFYGIEEDKEKIEKTGARFRLFSHRNGVDFTPGDLNDKHRNKKAFNHFADIFDCIRNHIPAVMKDIEAEKPSLIVYDPLFVIGRFMQEYLEKNGTSIKFLLFYPNFVITKEMMKEIPGLFKIDFDLFVGVFRVFQKQISLKWDLGTPVLNPMDVMFGLKRNTKIIAVFPELHPKVNEYDNKHKFVGQCISEEVRKYDLNEDPELKSVLDLFPIKENKAQSKQQLKLIYVSLGTLFSSNTAVFEKIIEALRTYNDKDKPNHKMKSSQFRVVISTGETSLKALNKKISEGKLIIPDNILLRAQVPQLELLKRADLFVTHSGMNSTSETIKYAVPIVSIPLEADQHMNGKRMCDELKLGVRLDARKLDVDSIIEAIDEVLSEDKYAKNIQDMSAISAKYNGAVESAKIIAEFLNQNEVENKLISTKTKSNQANPFFFLFFIVSIMIIFISTIVQSQTLSKIRMNSYEFV